MSIVLVGYKRQNDVRTRSHTRTAHSLLLPVIKRVIGASGAQAQLGLRCHGVFRAASAWSPASSSTSQLLLGGDRLVSHDHFTLTVQWTRTRSARGIRLLRLTVRLQDVDDTLLLGVCQQNQRTPMVWPWSLRTVSTARFVCTHGPGSSQIRATGESHSVRPTLACPQPRAR